MPAFDLTRFENTQAIQDYLQQILAAGPLPICCIRFGWWFVRSWRPTRSPSWPRLAGTAADAAALRVVVRSNVAF